MKPRRKAPGKKMGTGIFLPAPILSTAAVFLRYLLAVVFVPPIVTSPIRFVLV